MAHYYNKGHAFCHLRRYEEAVAAFDEVLRIDPGYAEARDNRCTALYNLVEELRQSIRL